MSRNDIRKEDLEPVVANRGPSFQTMDVADDDSLRAKYPELIARGVYNQSIGRALSEHQVALAITKMNDKNPRGMRWRKQTLPATELRSEVSSNTASSSNTTRADDTTLGPQSPSDDPFTARMRRHQSWYRANILRVPCGVGPKPTSTTHYGDMLTLGDGAAGRNFLTPEIADVARARVAEGVGAVEPFRLFHNMLSSQPMCFNLFGPLVRDTALAGRLLPALIPEPVAEVTRVVLEYGPEPAADYLGDRTAFDAFIEYRTPDRRLHALGIETKLTESFSAKVYDREEYRRWMHVPNRPWLPDADARVEAVEHNQLWRDHLLAVAVRHRSGSPYTTSRLLVVHHPEDGRCVQVYAGYRALLCDGDNTLSIIALDQLVDAWSRVVEQPARTAWLESFRTRYLDLALSAG